MARKRREPELVDDLDDHNGLVARAGGVARDNPVAAGGVIVMALTGCLIIANAVGLQNQRHPAPLFATRDRPAEHAPEAPDELQQAAAPEVSALVFDLQTELRRIGIYEGPLDGINGPATERAIRHFQRLSGQVENGEPSEALLAMIALEGAAPTENSVPVPRAKPGTAVRSENTFTAEEPTTSEPDPNYDPRLAKVQQILSELGYGPLQADGLIGANTTSAIRRFELDRGLPLTGELTPSVLQRLEEVSGRTID